MFLPTNPEYAEAVQKLETVLSTLSVGSMIPYGELNKVAGNRDLSRRYRYLLDRARENTEKSLGCAFETVRGIGIKRMESASVPSLGLSYLRRCRAAAKRGIKRISRMNTNDMTEPEARSVIGSRAMLGAIHMIADGRKAQAISAVADPTKPIPPKNILDMFRV